MVDDLDHGVEHPVSIHQSRKSTLALALARLRSADGAHHPQPAGVILANMRDRRLMGRGIGEPLPGDALYQPPLRGPELDLVPVPPGHPERVPRTRSQKAHLKRCILHAWAVARETTERSNVATILRVIVYV